MLVLLQWMQAVDVSVTDDVGFYGVHMWMWMWMLRITWGVSVYEE